MSFFSPDEERARAEHLGQQAQEKAEVQHHIDEYSTHAFRHFYPLIVQKIRDAYATGRNEVSIEYRLENIEREIGKAPHIPHTMDPRKLGLERRITQQLHEEGMGFQISSSFDDYASEIDFTVRFR